MLVDPIHRANTRPYPPEAYHQLAERCVAALGATRLVSSVVVCGSLIKNDLVRGWSDLDLVVFLPRTPNDLLALHNIGHALAAAQEGVSIGIGIDIVYHDEFAVTNKFGARPLAMSYEVAAYGETRFGPSPFTALRYDPDLTAYIDIERSIAISAELHNWRRALLSHRPDSATDIDWLAKCVKTMLKLLKYETDPNISPPFTYTSSLNRLIASNPSHPAIAGFSEAVATRAAWTEYITDPDNVTSRLTSLRGRWEIGGRMVA